MNIKTQFDSQNLQDTFIKRQSTQNGNLQK